MRPFNYFLFFSFDLLSLIIAISFSVIRVQLFSLAQSTHPFKTNFKNGRGTFTSIFNASSVNFTTSSARSAAYLIDVRSTSLSGIPSACAVLYPEHQKFLESRYPQFVGIGAKLLLVTPLTIAL